MYLIDRIDKNPDDFIHLHSKGIGARELIELRTQIFHTQKEFAQLLSQLRASIVSPRTVEGWESGRTRRIPVYQTDVEAIKRKTAPTRQKCKQCDAQAVVRKNRQNLCADCATPRLFITKGNVKTKAAA